MRRATMSSQSERTYSVKGMTCEHCELSVREEVEELAGVKSAQADRATGRLIVRGDGIDDQAVRDAVQAAGYNLAPAGSGEPAADLDVNR
jgi:copper chaperone